MLIVLLQDNNVETRGFAAACLSCCCKDFHARKIILDLGGEKSLLALAYNPSVWLRGQAKGMLHLLGVPIGPPPPTVTVSGSAKEIPSPELPAPESADGDGLGPLLSELGNEQDQSSILHGGSRTARSGITTSRGGNSTARSSIMSSSQRGGPVFGPAPWIPSANAPRHVKMKFHFFSFQLNKGDSPRTRKWEQQQ